MPDTTIYKVLTRELWSAAEAAGQFEGAGIDVQDGYIHFSTREQVVETVQKHFAGQDDLVLVAIDTEKIGQEVMWEPSRGGALFPHLYGNLPTAAAVRVADLPLASDGQHQFPADF